MTVRPLNGLTTNRLSCVVSVGSRHVIGTFRRMFRFVKAAPKHTQQSRCQLKQFGWRKNGNGCRSESLTVFNQSKATGSSCTCRQDLLGHVRSAFYTRSSLRCTLIDRRTFSKAYRTESIVWFSLSARTEVISLVCGSILYE